jgi:hypothetical protein
MTGPWCKSTHSSDGACVEVSLPQWRKSTFSGTNGCVEVSLPEWRKSSRSHDSGCVEVAHQDGAVLVRDSKHPQGPVLRFTPREWEAFVAGVLDDEFSLPDLR